MNITVERITYYDGDQELKGVLAVPKNPTGKLPVVLVFHALFGLGEHEEETAEWLAKFGFVAFAADCYGGGVQFTNREEAFAELNKYRQARPTLLRGRLLAALNYVESLPFVDHEKINAIGFCFGGMCSLDLARINAVASAVSFHGALQPIDDEAESEKLEPIRAKLLICHGDEDSHVNPTVDGFIDEMRTRKADLQFVRYANAKHGFTMSSNKFDSIPGVGYHELTAKRSKLAMLVLFNRMYGLPKMSVLDEA